MRTRWIFLGVAASLAVLLAVGFAFAADRGSDPAQQMGSGWDRVAMAATCDAMHDSPAMQRLHEGMAPDAATQCDAMHEQMAQMMGQMDGMMGSGISGVGDTDGHHAAMETWR